MSFIDIFREVKNSTLTTLGKKFINGNFKKYGKIIDFKIDSKNKNIVLDVLLKGEKENILIKIEKYAIIKRNDSNIVKFKNVSSSREWIEVLIKDIAPGNIMKIDSNFARIIDMLI